MSGFGRFPWVGIDPWPKKTLLPPLPDQINFGTGNVDGSMLYFGDFPVTGTRPTNTSEVSF